MTRGKTSFLIVDKNTGRMDWSDELYPSEDAAIASLCAPRQDYGNDAHDPRQNWREVYEIRRVMPARAARGSAE